MDNEIAVELDNNKIIQYDIMLGRFRNWIQFKRDIKLTNLLEHNRKIQFDLENINGLYGGVYSGENPIHKFKLIDEFAVKSMKFIINQNGVNIDSLKLKIKPFGNLMEKMLNQEYKIYQNISNDQVISFYIKFLFT